MPVACIMKEVLDKTMDTPQERLLKRTREQFVDLPEQGAKELLEGIADIPKERSLERTREQIADVSCQVVKKRSSRGS